MPNNMSAKSGHPLPMSWTHFRVSWQGINKLCGSVPSDPEIVKAWLDARKPAVRPPQSRSLQDINEEVLASLAAGAAADEDLSILTFQRDHGALVQRAGTIKSHLKDCARVLSRYSGRIERETAFSTKVTNAVYPEDLPYWVEILRPDGAVVTKHDGELDRSVTPAFGRTALKRFEWIEPWRLDFTLKIVTFSGKPVVGLEDLETLMLYGGTHGYAGERGAGEGKYVATIIPIIEKENDHGETGRHATTASHRR